jgi:hypothetical protein
MVKLLQQGKAAVVVLIGIMMCVFPGGLAAPDGRKAQSAKPRLMNEADVRLAYKLLESMNPFPREAAETSLPLAWRLSSALAEAASLAPSSMFVHMLILVALTLRAVQVKYSGLLGRYCNLVMLQNGAPGDGKSVQLWFNTQVTMYYDKCRDTLAMEAFRTKWTQYKTKLAEAEGKDEPSPDAPEKPDTCDSVFNRGTWVGLGQFLKHQLCTAYYALHEGRSWVPLTFEGGPNGGIEDFNMIYDHDLYKNNPANSNGKFHCRCPHVCGVVLNHLEETVAQSEKEDTAFGMARFVHSVFPMVANKIRPEGAADVAAHVAEESYFNDLTYDQCVSCMAHVMLVAARLFPYGQKRDDADQHPGCYSKLLGVHSLPWEPAVKADFREEFNKFVDEIREDQMGTGEKSSRLNKEKTRPLQFMAPADVFEKVLEYLLQVSSKKDVPRQNLTGVAIVIAIADVDIFKVLKELTPKAIEPKLRAPSVQVALKMAVWFQKNYALIMNMKQVVQKFKTDRQVLAVVPPALPEEAIKLLSHETKVHMNVAETLCLIGAGFDFKAFCANPLNTNAEINAKKFDLVVLALMGFIVVVSGRFKVVDYHIDDEDGVRALNRLTAWDDSVDLREVESWLPPSTATVDKVTLLQDEADQAVTAIKRLLDGGAATMERMPCPVVTSTLPVSLPATQASDAPLPGMVAEASSSVARDGREALTQDRPGEAEDDEVEENETGPRPKRLREEGPLAAEDWEHHGLLLGRIVTYIVCSTSATGTQRRLLKAKWKTHAAAKNVDKLITCAFRLLEDMGLALRSNRGASIELYAPPDAMKEKSVKALVSMLGLNAASESTLGESLAERDVNEYLDEASIDAAVTIAGDSLRAP